jgi:hypothetical protein
MNIFSEDDILDYIIDNIHMLDFHILDYDKLRKVSVNFNKKFNLRLLYIENKKYNGLMLVGGFTYKHVLNIIEKGILYKFCLNKKKFIIENIIQYSKLHLHLLIITSKLCIYIEYLIELLYNSCYKKHKNIIKIFNNISQNISIYKYSNIHDILNIVGICLDMYKDIDKYYIRQGGTSLCYTLNISIFVFILIKGIYNIFKNCSKDDIPKEFSIKLNKLFIIQNQKLSEYKENFINKDSDINRTFPKYYLKYVMNSLDDFYITI